MQTKMTIVTVAVAAVLFGTALPPVALAQAAAPQSSSAESLDARWLPWFGCWQLWEEQRGTPLNAGPGFSHEAEADDETRGLIARTLVCVTPSETGPGVELTAAAGERPLVERTLFADGRQRDVDEPGCEGWEQSEWATDGQRLFTHAELTCGDQPKRTVKGVSVMATRSTWTDIQIIEVGSRQHVEIRRYNPVSAERRDQLLGAARRLPVDPAEVRAARTAVTESVTVADLMEASEKTAPQVVEALLVETEPRLALDSEALIALDDAGVDGTVIDLMVALAYPERFQVERRDRSGGWSSGSWSADGVGGYYDPIWYGDLYPYYVTPLGSTYWSRGYNPYLVGAAPFVVVPVELNVDERSGRAVQSRGYTRIVRVAPAASDGGTTTGRRAKPRGSGSGGTSTNSGSSGTATGSSGTATGRGVASPGGYSRGGSSSGRAAAPRSPR